MEEAVKTIAQQVITMKRNWPRFEVADQTADSVIWFGLLAGIEKPYRLMIEYGLPRDPVNDPMSRRFPLVRVVTPKLKANFDASEEAPLPHVYFDQEDLLNSPLCLFDPNTDKWSHNSFIALTTIPWAAEWLACYEGWLATGKWFGGGRHASPKVEGAVQ